MKRFKEYLMEMQRDKEAREAAARTNATVEKRYTELKKKEIIKK